MHIEGNSEILNLPKTAFLCSRSIPATVVLKCYDWAIEKRNRGECIISGFHSQIEKDVLHYLLKGKQPIIIALARGLKERYEPEILKAIDENRLLVVTPFEQSVQTVTSQTAVNRNQFMVELSDEVVIGYASPCGQLEEMLERIKKPWTRLVE